MKRVKIIEWNDVSLVFGFSLVEDLPLVCNINSRVLIHREYSMLVFIKARSLRSLTSGDM